MEDIQYAIEPTKETGFSTVEVILSGKKTFLHSKINPARESETQREQISKITQDTVIAYGAGLGYTLIPVCNNHAIKRLIIIERLNNINTHLLNTFAKDNHNCEIIILSGMNCDQIATALDELLDFTIVKGIAFLDHPASLRLFPEYYSSVKSTVDSRIRYKAGNEATKKNFLSLFFRNAIKNISQLRIMSALSSIRNLWSGYPCLVISSAPSIDYFINVIKSHKNNFFILSVDSAYPILRSHGIRPDLIISIDPQPWTEEHLRNMDQSIPVITSLTSWNHAFKKSFLSINSHPLSQLRDHTIPNIGSVDTHTGTDAGDAIAAAIYHGASRI